MFRVLYSYFKVKKQSINSNISDALVDSLPKGTTVEFAICADARELGFAERYLAKRSDYDQEHYPHYETAR